MELEDIYGDLDEFHEQEEKKSKELLELEVKHNEALKTIDAMKLEKKDLRKKIRIMEQNLQSLLDTAKAEIKRKDKIINDLRKEKDDICFRRRKINVVPATPAWSSNVYHNKQYGEVVQKKDAEVQKIENIIQNVTEVQSLKPKETKTTSNNLLNATGADADNALSKCRIQNNPFKQENTVHVKLDDVPKMSTTDSHTPKNADYAANNRQCSKNKDTQNTIADSDFRSGDRCKIDRKNANTDSESNKSQQSSKYKRNFMMDNLRRRSKSQEKSNQISKSRTNLNDGNTVYTEDRYRRSKSKEKLSNGIDSDIRTRDKDLIDSKFSNTHSERNKSQHNNVKERIRERRRSRSKENPDKHGKSCSRSKNGRIDNENYGKQRDFSPRSRRRRSKSAERREKYVKSRRRSSDGADIDYKRRKVDIGNDRSQYHSRDDDSDFSADNQRTSSERRRYERDFHRHKHDKERTRFEDRHIGKYDKYGYRCSPKRYGQEKYDSKNEISNTKRESTNRELSTKEVRKKYSDSSERSTSEPRNRKRHHKIKSSDYEKNNRNSICELDDEELRERLRCAEKTLKFGFENITTSEDELVIEAKKVILTSIEKPSTELIVEEKLKTNTKETKLTGNIVSINHVLRNHENDLAPAAVNEINSDKLKSTFLNGEICAKSLSDLTCDKTKFEGIYTDENSNFSKTSKSLNTPRSIALFDALFGASPKVTEQQASGTGELLANVKEMLNKTSGGSTTTASEDYTDVSNVSIKKSDSGITTSPTASTLGSMMGNNGKSPPQENICRDNALMCFVPTRIINISDQVCNSPISVISINSNVTTPSVNLKIDDYSENSEKYVDKKVAETQHFILNVDDVGDTCMYLSKRKTKEDCLAEGYESVRNVKMSEQQIGVDAVTTALAEGAKISVETTTTLTEAATTLVKEVTTQGKVTNTIIETDTILLEAETTSAEAGTTLVEAAPKPLEVAANLIDATAIPAKPSLTLLEATIIPAEAITSAITAADIQISDNFKADIGEPIVVDEESTTSLIDNVIASSAADVTSKYKIKSAITTSAKAAITENEAPSNSVEVAKTTGEVGTNSTEAAASLVEAALVAATTTEEEAASISSEATTNLVEALANSVEVITFATTAADLKMSGNFKADVVERNINDENTTSLIDDVIASSVADIKTSNKVKLAITTSTKAATIKEGGEEEGVLNSMDAVKTSVGTTAISAKAATSLLAAASTSVNAVTLVDTTTTSAKATKTSVEAVTPTTTADKKISKNFKAVIEEPIVADIKSTTFLTDHAMKLNVGNVKRNDKANSAAISAIVAHTSQHSLPKFKDAVCISELENNFCNAIKSGVLVKVESKASTFDLKTENESNTYLEVATVTETSDTSEKFDLNGDIATAVGSGLILDTSKASYFSHKVSVAAKSSIDQFESTNIELRKAINVNAVEVRHKQDSKQTIIENTAPISKVVKKSAVNDNKIAHKLKKHELQPQRAEQENTINESVKQFEFAAKNVDDLKVVLRKVQANKNLADDEPKMETRKVFDEANVATINDAIKIVDLRQNVVEASQPKTTTISGAAAYDTFLVQKLTQTKKLKGTDEKLCASLAYESSSEESSSDAMPLAQLRLKERIKIIENIRLPTLFNQKQASSQIKQHQSKQNSETKNVQQTKKITLPKSTKSMTTDKIDVIKPYTKFQIASMTTKPTCDVVNVKNCVSSDIAVEATAVGLIASQINVLQTTTEAETNNGQNTIDESMASANVETLQELNANKASTSLATEFLQQLPDLTQESRQNTCKIQQKCQKAVSKNSKQTSPNKSYIKLDVAKTAKSKALKHLASAAEDGIVKPKAKRVYRKKDLTIVQPETEIVRKVVTSTLTAPVAVDHKETLLNASDDFKALLTVDNKFADIDKSMQAIFQSPIKELNQTIGNNNYNVTIDETTNQVDVDSIQQAELEQAISSILIAEDNSSITTTPEYKTTPHDNSFERKYLSLGSSEYLIERISENVVTMSITRKRRKKPKMLEKNSVT